MNADRSDFAKIGVALLAVAWETGAVEPELPAEKEDGHVELAITPRHLRCCLVDPVRHGVTILRRRDSLRR